jgi:hypothetical protein
MAFPADARGGAKRGVSRALKRMERETGIEPATNSLEGCDSTTELLPLTLASLSSVPCTSFECPNLAN